MLGAALLPTLAGSSGRPSLNLSPCVQAMGDKNHPEAGWGREGAGLQVPTQPRLAQAGRSCLASSARPCRRRPSSEKILFSRGHL